MGEGFRKLWGSQQLVSRASSAFGRNPVDHLIRIHDVARLAMDAVGGIDLQAKLSVSGIGHLINGGRTEELAGVTVFGSTARMANIRLQDDEMAWLIFVVIGSRIINIREFVKRQFAVEDRRGG